MDTNAQMPSGTRARAELATALREELPGLDHYLHIFFGNEEGCACPRIRENPARREEREGYFLTRLRHLVAQTRPHALAAEIRDYLACHPEALVVDLGCGLHTSCREADNGRCHICNIDFPDVIARRRAALPEGDREVSMAVDVTDPSWFDRIDFDPAKGAVFVVCGVFLYLRKRTVRTLLGLMAEHFPGARIVFDAHHPRTAQTMLGPLRRAGIDVSTNFSLADPVGELSAWNRLFGRVQSKGMCLGHLGPSGRREWGTRLLAWHADRCRLAQINVIDFRK